MKEEEVLACQFQAWYPRFRSISLKSTIIPLSEEIVEYLTADGIALPESAKHTTFKGYEGVEEVWDMEEEEAWREAREQPDDVHAPEMRELEERVSDVIAEYDGEVFPKLNWSSPKDAVWMSPGGTAKCLSLSDALLLLKSSDNVTHDLCRAFDECEDKSRSRPDEFVLVLRKWYDVRRSQEFRCFVRNCTLFAVCQRHHDAFYKHLLDCEDKIIDTIGAYFEDHIMGSFPLDNYTFDCIVKPDEGKMYLVDFNPYGTSTDPLMFTWDELDQRIIPPAPEPVNIKLKIVMKPVIQASVDMLNRYPTDVFDLGAMRGQDANQRGIDHLVEVMRKHGAVAGGQSDSDDEGAGAGEEHTPPTDTSGSSADVPR